MYDVLVTGGSGFIGTATVRLLRANGVRVAAGMQGLGGADVDTVGMELRDPQSVRDVVRRTRPAAIVHLASSMDVTGEGPQALVEANVLGSLHLLEAALVEGCKRFVFGSSVMVYGPASGDGEVDIDESRPLDPKTLYGSGKVFVESLLGQPRYRSQMFTGSLRFTTVYGPGRLRRGACPYVVDAFRAPSGDGSPARINTSQRTDVVHVEDAADAVLRALRVNKLDGPYNIGHHEVGGAELAKTVRTCRPGTSLDEYEGEQSSWPSRISNVRACRELGWVPKYSLERGAEDTIRWFEDHGAQQVASTPEAVGSKTTQDEHPPQRRTS